MELVYRNRTFFIGIGLFGSKWCKPLKLASLLEPGVDARGLPGVRLVEPHPICHPR